MADHAVNHKELMAYYQEAVTFKITLRYKLIRTIIKSTWQKTYDWPNKGGQVQSQVRVYLRNESISDTITSNNHGNTVKSNT